MGYNRLPTVQEKRHDISLEEESHIGDAITLPEFNLETEHEGSELVVMANGSRYKEIKNVSNRFGIDISDAAYAIDTIGPIHTLIEFAYLLSQTDSGNFRKAVDRASNADKMPQESRIYETLVAVSEVSGVDLVKVIDSYAVEQHEAKETLSEKALITARIIYSSEETEDEYVNDPVSSKKSLQERTENSFEGCPFTEDELEVVVEDALSKQF